MRSFRRVTQRVAPALAAMLSVFALATCDLDKISGTPKPLDREAINRLFSITGDSVITLGGTLGLGISSTADLTHTAQRWASSNPTLATVDSLSGLVSGLALGVVNITASLLAPELDTGYVQQKTLRVRYKGIRIASVDSIAGLGLTKPIVVNGTNNANALQSPAITSTTALTTRDTTIARVEGQVVRGRKAGTTFLVGFFESFRDSVAIRVRQVAKSITFPTTEYAANSLNANRTMPLTVRDIADSVILTPTLRWRSNDASVVTIDSITGVFQVKKIDTTSIFVRADTVIRTQRVTVAQVVGSMTKFAGDAQTDTVGQALPIAPTVTAVDSGGAAVAGATVVFSVATGAGSVTGGTAITNALGRASVGTWTLGPLAGTQSLLASSGGATQTFTATAIADSPAGLAFEVQPAPTGVAPTAIAPAVKVRIVDAGGNLVTNATNSVTLALGVNPTGAALGGTTTAAAVNGVATFSTLTVNLSGAGYTLVASSAGLTGATSNSFHVFGAATKLAFAQAPSNVVVSRTMAPPVRVAIQDAAGNTVTTSTASVTLSLSPNAGALGGTLTVNAVAGIATFSNLTIGTVASGYQVTAASGSLTTATSPAFNVIAVGPPAGVAFVTEPTNTVAGASINASTSPAGIRVAIVDSGGATVTSSTQNVTLAILANPANGTISGTTSANAVAGIATFTGLSIAKTGNGYTLLAVATSTTLGSDTSATFNVTPGAAAKVGFVAQPSNIGPAGTIAPSVQVAVQDALGNTVTSQAATSVSVSITSGTGTAGATLSGTTAQTTSGGVATFNNLSINTAGLNYTLTAVASSLQSGSSATFSVVAAGTASKLRFLTQPANGTAGTLGTMQVEVIDAAGTRVTSANPSILLSFGNNAGGGSLGGSVQVSSTSGVATFSSVSIPTAGTGYTLVATATAAVGGVTLTPATSQGFNLSAGTATKLAYTVQPSNAVAGVPFSPTIAVAVQDANGNTVTNASNTVELILQNNPNPFTVTLQGNVSVAAVNGIATFPGVNLNRSGTGYTIFAKFPGTFTGAVLSSAFNITPTAAVGLSFKQQPSNANAGSPIAPAVQVQVVDQFDNLISTATDAITVAISSGPAGAVLSGTKTQSAVSGVATFSNLSLDKATTSVQYVLSASAPNLASAASNQFFMNPGTAAKLKWVTTPGNTVRGAPLAPTNGFGVEVAVTDALDNQIFSNSTTFPVTVALLANPGAATLGGNKTITTNFGTSLFSDLTVSAAANGYTLQATSGGLTSATTPVFDVAAFGTKSKLVFTTQPTTTVVNATMAPPVTVAIQDQYGNTVTSATDAIGLFIANDANPTTILTGGGSVAAVAGVATFAGLSLNKTGFPYTLQPSGPLFGAASSAFSVVASANSWQNLTAMPAARYGPAVGFVDEVLYVAGGHTGSSDNNSLQAYNANTATWTTLASMPAGRYQGDGAVALGGELYVPGGWTTASGVPQNSLFIYTPGANTWRSGTAMPTISGCGMSGVISGKIYVTTGCNGVTGYRNFLHVYDPATQAWTQLTNSPNAHGSPAGGVINGKLYVVGGQNAAGSAVTGALDIYDPVANSWTTGTAMPTAREGATAVVFNGKLYVIGGANAGGVLATVEIYDPVGNSWTSGAAMSVARSVPGAGILNGLIFVAGGSNGSTALATFAAYTP